MSWRAATVALSTAALLAGCAATTRQAPAVDIDIVESGFLTDYSVLLPGEKGQARLLYRNPDADFAKYDKILFTRVHVWRAQENSLDNVEEKELQRLADDLYFTIRTKLEADYEFTEVPEESAMAIHMALTDVSDPNVPLDVFATLASPAGLPAEEEDLATETQVFLRSAMIEIEIEDSVTREILVAAVDKHVGRTSVSGSLDSWSDVDKAFEYWADRIATRLGEARVGKF